MCLHITKLLFSVFQVLTFRDYLFHIVGPDFISRQLSTYPGYDESVDPSISNVFATAAYRFAHLMVQPIISRLDANYRENHQYPSVLLHRAFYTPWRIIYEGTTPMVDPFVLCSRNDQFTLTFPHFPEPRRWIGPHFEGACGP